MTLDFDLDSERARQLLILGCGIIVGYLCVVLAIELELYYYQSRFVVAELYKRLSALEDVKTPSQFREGESMLRSDVTSSRQGVSPEPVPLA